MPKRRLELPDPDFVAIPLSRTELELLVNLWNSSDEITHEELSIELKARAALDQILAPSRRIVQA